MRRAHIGRTALLFVALATPVYPCGGPEHYPIDAPLVRADAYLQALETVDDFDFRTRPELRFLYPFLASGGAPASAMWMHSYGDAHWNPVDGVDSTATFAIDAVSAGVLTAGRSGSVDSLARAARRTLDAALDAPATVADEAQPAVRRAVEALEIIVASERRPATGASPVVLSAELVRRLYGDADVQDVVSLPAWARDVVELRGLSRDSMPGWGDRHPGSARQGSLQFVALQLAMRRGIPDGWARETRDSVPPARWRALEAMHDDWLQRFTGHPLVPWVQLSRLRLAYFAGDSARAWDVALAVYPTHRWRALDEMRFLLRQSMYPPSLDDPRIDDALRAALLGEIPLDGRWMREWERALATNAPWGSEARERLMWRAARDSAAANDAYAATLADPGVHLSPLANALRLVALVRMGNVPVAMRVADSLALPRAGERAEARVGERAEARVGERADARVEIDSVVAPIRVQLLLAGGRWSDALADARLASEARRYLVRVMAPDSVLDRLAQSPDTLISREVQRTRALRQAAAGAWSAGSARLPASDAARAARWRATQRLANDTSLDGRLAFARYMREQNGKLFGGNDKVWYRSLNWRLRAIGDSTSADFNPILPWRASDETRAIGRHFRDSFEMFQAVRAYADFLQRAPRRDSRRSAALREANQTYNWLINWDNNNSSFWGEELERDGIGRAIRAAGRG